MMVMDGVLPYVLPVAHADTGSAQPLHSPLALGPTSYERSFPMPTTETKDSSCLQGENKTTNNHRQQINTEYSVYTFMSHESVMRTKDFSPSSPRCTFGVWT
jgi:hypothetical protein